ncbi:SDR family NAD(P)-dependent oxidoreductase, partial [Nocardia salmonicida]|uniref:SDR family NAD(P)-dependent oxidoreductase n=1 Tax=Nocardia salmonicida TaxID=53431 RepID=UPI003443BB39
MNRMQNTVALVTGAAGGMGRAHCRRLAEEGADIIALDIEAAAAELAQTAVEVETLGRLCVTGVADVRDQAQLDVAVADGVAALGRLDVIVANAGIYSDLGLSWELSDQAWQRTIDINLTGMWHTVRAAVPALSDGGSVVIVSSTNGIVGAAAAAPKKASKRPGVGHPPTQGQELGPPGERGN